jgi:quercetin dioxygenase-like cupin family protein
MKIKRVGLFCMVAGVALTGSSTVVGTMPAVPKIENLFQVALDEDFTPDREVIVSMVEVPPNTTMERHWHPGEEFHYCLEGETELQIDGQASVMETPGKVSHVPYKKLHTVVTKEKGVKLLVFRVHKKGEPVRFLESGGELKK